MLLIGEVLVSDALIEDEFVCHIEKCKGACCWKGDYGAPLEPEEIELLNADLPALEPYLSVEGLERIQEMGVSQYFDKPKFHGATLLDNGACAFLHTDPDGITKCGIEKAHEDGVVGWKKPISCHLYPVRVRKIPEVDFEALNYDIWSICSDACTLGKSLKVPVYQFVRDAIIRRYGEAFWNELHDVAQDLKSKNFSTNH